MAAVENWHPDGVFLWLCNTHNMVTGPLSLFRLFKKKRNWEVLFGELFPPIAQEVHIRKSLNKKRQQRKQKGRQGRLL